MAALKAPFIIVMLFMNYKIEKHLEIKYILSTNQNWFYSSQIKLDNNIYYTNFTEFWDSKKGIIAPLDLTPLTGLTSFDTLLFLLLDFLGVDIFCSVPLLNTSGRSLYSK